MADLDFGELKPGERTVQSCTVPVADRGETPSLSGDSGFVLDGGISGIGLLAVKFTAGLVAAGTKSATLTVGSSTFSLEAEVVHELEVQSAVYVGATTVGGSVTKQVTVTNRTDSDATLTPSGEFTVSPATVSASTGPQNVTVTFTPTGLDTRTGTLSASAGALTDVGELSGTGIEEGESATTGSLGVDSLETETDGSATKTTYKVHVPSYETKMHLGAAVTPFTYLNGFGLTTTAKGLLEATGNIGVSSSEGNVMLQAEGTGSDSGGGLYTVSKNNTVIAAGGSAYVIGDGGVTISTAADVSPKRSSDGLPDPGQMTDASNIASGIFAALDGLVALASLFRVGFTTWAGWSTSTKADVGLAAVSGGAAFTATMLGGFSVANAAGASFSVPGVTIYGHAGVLIGTAGFGGFYAPAGLVLGSIFPVLLGMDAELLGLRTANLTGKHANVDGLTDATVRGKTQAKVTSADEVVICVDQSGAAPTTSIELDHESVEVETTDLVRFRVGQLGTVYLVKVDSQNGIDIGVADANGVLDTTKAHAKITEDSIKLAISDTGAYAEMEANLVRIRHASNNGFGLSITDQLVSLYDGPGKHLLKIQNNLVSLEAGSSANKVQLSSSGIVAKGSLIKWG